MKHLLTLFACIITGLFTGCTTPQYNYRPEKQRISFPEIGKVVTVNVGDEMLRQGIYSEIDAIKLSSSIKIGTIGTYTLGPGIYDKKGENRTDEFYMPAEGSSGGSVIKGAISDPWQAVIYAKDQDEIGIVTIFGVAAKDPAVGVQKIKRPSLADDSFQQTLIYSGKIGSKVKLGYREFSNSVARPAYNNDVDYDLNESKLVGYKGARIEILEASNQSITYKVISNFIQN
jgi:hypothetical protein